MVRLIPKDTSFFEMFSEMANNFIAGARVMVDLFADYRDVEMKIQEIRRIEHVGDEMTHSIMRNSTRPYYSLYREDLHKLASSLDECWTSSTQPAPGSLCTA